MDLWSMNKSKLGGHIQPSHNDSLDTCLTPLPLPGKNPKIKDQQIYNS